MNLDTVSTSRRARRARRLLENSPPFAHAFTGYGSGGQGYIHNGVAYGGTASANCCWYKGTVCTGTGSPVYARKGVVTPGKVYKISGTCYLFSATILRCLPSGAVAVTSVGSPFDDCTSCAGAQKLQARLCSNNSLSGLWALPTDVQQGGVYKLGGVCYIFSDPPATTGAVATTGWLGPYATCTTCNQNRCASMSEKGLLITISGVAIDTSCHWNGCTTTLVEGPATLNMTINIPVNTFTMPSPPLPLTKYIIAGSITPGPCDRFCNDTANVIYSNGTVRQEHNVAVVQIQGPPFSTTNIEVLGKDTNSHLFFDFRGTCVNGHWVMGSNLVTSYAASNNIDPSPPAGFGIGGTCTVDYV